MRGYTGVKDPAYKLGLTDCLPPLHRSPLRHRGVALTGKPFSGPAKGFPTRGRIGRARAGRSRGWYWHHDHLRERLSVSSISLSQKSIPFNRIIIFEFSVVFV